MTSQAGCALTYAGYPAGAYAGDGVTCASINCPQPPTGACCIPDGSCSITTSAACAAADGNWSGPGTFCPTNGCPDVLYTGLPTSTHGSNSSVFFDLTPNAGRSLVVSAFDYQANSTVGVPCTIQIWTRPGTF